MSNSEFKMYQSFWALQEKYPALYCLYSSNIRGRFIIAKRDESGHFSIRIFDNTPAKVAKAIVNIVDGLPVETAC